jgi:hypothetical protein
MAEPRSHEVQQSLGALSVLPDALLSCILFLLDAASLCRLACCSRVLRVFSCEEPLWLQQALQGYHGRIKYLVSLLCVLRAHIQYTALMYCIQYAVCVLATHPLWGLQFLPVAQAIPQLCR